MSQKQVQIYEDSVLKLSIKQGEEIDRVPATATGINSINYEKTSIAPGSFTMGELAFTRDTGRVFAGNFTTDVEELYDQPYTENKTQKIQQTVGGTLAGNKYLGYIDTKPPYNNTTSDSAPLPLTEDAVYEIQLINEETGEKTFEEVVSPAALLEDSAFRSYEFGTEEDPKTCITTEDKKWSRQSYYNEKYDAYDGDYLYDIYRNAIILFDHNIKPTDEAEWESDSEVQSTRRRSKLLPLENDKVEGDTTSPETVYNHTLDMYGDGYVCIYNVVPDGDTLTFNQRVFSNTTGAPEKGNYTQNIIKVQKVYAGAMINALDPAAFTLETNKETAAEIIKLGPSQKFNEIALPTETDYLVLPNRLGLSKNVYTEVQPFVIAESDNREYILKFTYNNQTHDDRPVLTASFSTADTSPVYTIHLGTGLKSGTGDSFVRLSPTSTNSKIVLDVESSGGASTITNNPFNIPETSSVNLYSGNLMMLPNGSAIGENYYAEGYAEIVKPITDNYDNENTKLNYLNQSIPIAKGPGTETIKFKIDPVVYAAKKPTTTLQAVGINGAVSINGKTVAENDLKKTYIFTENGVVYEDEDGDIITPAGYSAITAAGKRALISHPINGEVIHYEVTDVSDTSLETVGANLSVLGTGKKIKISKPILAETFTVVIIDGTENPQQYTGLSEIYISALHKIYTPNTFALLAEELENCEIELNDVTDENSEIIGVTFDTVYTNNLTMTEMCRVEFVVGDIVEIIQVPLTKYVTKFTYDDEHNSLSTTELSSIIEIEFYYSTVGNSASTYNHRVITAENMGMSGEGDPKVLYVNEDFIFNKTGKVTGTPTNNWNNRLYKMVVKNDVQEHSYNFVTNNYVMDPAPATGSTITTLYPTTADEKLDAVTDYTPMNGTWGSVIKIEENRKTFELKEYKYYRSNEFDINLLLDAWQFYYADEEQTTLLDTTVEEGKEDEWLAEQRINVMRLFPILPTHTTSVLLEAKAGASSTIKISVVGNGKGTNYDGTVPHISGVTGIIKPNDLNTVISDWTQAKLVLNVTAGNTEYVEVPVSLDADGNKHFTIKIEATGANATISLAAYRV